MVDGGLSRAGGPLPILLLGSCAGHEAGHYQKNFLNTPFEGRLAVRHGLDPHGFAPSVSYRVRLSSVEFRCVLRKQLALLSVADVRSRWDPYARSGEESWEGIDKFAEGPGERSKGCVVEDGILNLDHIEHNGRLMSKSSGWTWKAWWPSVTVS
jgi:hypothetical protein